MSAPGEPVLHSTFGSIENLDDEYLRKNYLLGLTFVDEHGAEYPQDWYRNFINIALSTYEETTQLVVKPLTITAEKHDYYLEDYEQYAFMKLHKRPVLPQTDSAGKATSPVVKAVYPTGTIITTFPAEWVHVDTITATLQLVPTSGTLSQVLLGAGGAFLPMVYDGLGRLPGLFRVDYTAGFKTGEVPHTILDAICKLACIAMLPIVGDTARPVGVASQSLGVDGLSQSRSFVNMPDAVPVFAGRVRQYERELWGDPSRGIPGRLNQTKDANRGLNMVVV